MELSNVIIKPYHTEKSYTIRKFQENSCLSFIVDRRATKIQIRQAFKSIYKVDPVKINVLNRKSQSFRNGTAKPGRTKQFKLAFIILPKGMQIAITKDEIEEAAKGADTSNKNDKDFPAKKQSTTKKEDLVKPQKEIKSDKVEKNTSAKSKPIRKQAKGK